MEKTKKVPFYGKRNIDIYCLKNPNQNRNVIDGNYSIFRKKLPEKNISYQSKNQSSEELNYSINVKPYTMIPIDKIDKLTIRPSTPDNRKTKLDQYVPVEKNSKSSIQDYCDTLLDLAKSAVDVKKEIIFHPPYGDILSQTLDYQATYLKKLTKSLNENQYVANKKIENVRCRTSKINGEKYFTVI